MTTPVVFPQRIQFQRTRGFRLGDAVYVARPSKLGNPFKVIAAPRPHGYQVIDTGGRSRTLREKPYYVPDRWAGHVVAVRLFELHASPQGLYPFDNAKCQAVAALRGRDLACYCPIDFPCHADTLLRWANPDLPWPTDDEEED